MAMTYLHAMRGERDQIKPEILAYRADEIVDGDLAEWVGGVHALLGEKSQALAFLGRAIKLGDHNYPWFLRDKNWNRLRGEGLMREVEGYWRRYLQEFSSGQLS
jgi:hypothetical protein